MKTSYQRIQQISIFVFMILLFLLCLFLFARSHFIINSFEQITDVHAKTHEKLFKVQQQFSNVGLAFFGNEDNAVQQREKTGTELRLLKKQVQDFMTLEQREEKAIHDESARQALHSTLVKLKRDQQKVLAAFYAYYGDVYTGDNTYEHSVEIRKTIRKSILDAISNASAMLTQLFTVQNEQMEEKALYITAITYTGVIIVSIILLIAAVLIVWSTKLVGNTISSIRHTTELISEGDFDREIKYTAKDDLGFLAHAINSMRLRLKEHIQSLNTEIELRKKSEQQASFLAYHDKLTGLPNRLYFSKILDREIVKAKRYKRLLALLFFDLDNFKNINDLYGHDVGDKLLKAAADKLVSNVREEDIVTRISGDEFVVLLTEIKTPEDASLVGEKLINVFAATKFNVEKISINITASIGIAVYPLTSCEHSELMKQADIAMYRAKRSGRNNCQNFLKGIDEEHKTQLELATRLPFAVKNEEFFLVYQPIMDLKTKKIIGMEALLRWLFPSKGTVMPNDFIPVAERSGMFTQLGFWVIQTAFRQLKVWGEQFPLQENYLSINLSAIQLEAEQIVQDIQNEAKYADINVSNIGFELTESAIMTDPEKAKAIINTLNQQGFKILIDDFGTGFSSFSRLKELELSGLKIDKSFIDCIGKHVVGERIIKAITYLADILNLVPIAEGVETAEQVDFLLKNGCSVAQGYYFSKPISAKEMTRFIEENLG